MVLPILFYRDNKRGKKAMNLICFIKGHRTYAKANVAFCARCMKTIKLVEDEDS